MSYLLSRQKSVKGDVVLITGGAMGIGRLMSIKFAQLGAIIIVWDLNEELGNQTVATIQQQGGEAHYYKVDITNRELVYATGQDVLKRFGSVDILINNAGIVHGKRLLDANDQMIDKTFHVNAISHFWMIKTFLPNMLKRNKGHIVSIASVAGLFGLAGMVDYCASKFASVGLMVSLRQELAAMGKDGIHCTLVCPSYISTGMFEGVTPLRFMGLLTPEYVADSIVRAVRRNQWRLLMPRFFYILEILILLLPDWMLHIAERLLGANKVMSTFRQTRSHTTIGNSRT